MSALRRTILALILACLVLPLSAARAPGWVDRPYSGLDEDEVIAATGSGWDRFTAQQQALSALGSVFSTSVQSSTSSYSGEVGYNGQRSVADSFHSTTSVGVSMDELVGASVTDYWQGDGQWYARAVLDRDEAEEYYGSVVDSILPSVRSELSRLQAKRGDLPAYFAAMALYEDIDRLEEAARVLQVVSGRNAADILQLRSQLDSIVRQLADGLSVGVEITGDVDGALEKAVGSCLSDRGIAVSRSSGARYVFTGGLTTSTSDGPRGNVYVDYEVDLEIVDRQSGRTVSRIRLSGREGHRNVSQAMSRVIATLETGLAQELDKVFSGQ